MTSERTVRHDHEPVYRVVRAGWVDPLDTSYSRRRSDNRWNPPDAFEVLYTCCSEDVARAIALDTFQYAGIVIGDLQPEVRPQLAEIGWDGEVVDMASPDGVQAAGFPLTYPTGIDHRQTQPCAVRWHAARHEGVVCRSASAERLGRSSWEGSHWTWSELAIFVETAQRAPRLLRRRGDLMWLDRPAGRRH